MWFYATDDDDADAADDADVKEPSFVPTRPRQCDSRAFVSHTLPFSIDILDLQ